MRVVRDKVSPTKQKPKPKGKRQMNTKKNEVKNINESVYGWWMRSYKNPTETRYFQEGVNYFANDVKNKTVTFKEVLEGMKNEKCVYKMCGIGDSEVRQAIFRRMCDLFDFDYEVIYNLWLGGFERVCQKSVVWAKLAKYRGKNAARLQDKTRKEAHLAFDDTDTVEYIKGRFAKFVEGYENLKKFYDFSK